MQVLWKHTMNQKSACEHGTMYQMKNYLGRSNVVMSPKNNMNSCKDFLVLLLHSYITVAAMKVVELDKIDNWPSYIQEEMWIEHKQKRRKEMDYILSQLEDKFLDIEYLHVPTDSHSTDDQDNFSALVHST